eukprot:Clim_evm73s207 gene=Clim_evmTU73s207
MAGSSADYQRLKAKIQAGQTALAESLGPRSEFYWNAFRKFATGVINKNDFQNMVSTLLDDDAKKLHNDFIMGLLYLSQQAVEEESLLKVVQVASLLQKLSPLEKAREEILRMVDTGVIENHPEADAAAALLLSDDERGLLAIDIQAERHSGTVGGLRSGMDGVQAPEPMTCLDLWALPSFWALHNRMFYTAGDHGLKDVDPEATVLLQEALEIHITSEISEAANKDGYFKNITSGHDNVFSEHLPVTDVSKRKRKMRRRKDRGSKGALPANAFLKDSDALMRGSMASTVSQERLWSVI